MVVVERVRRGMRMLQVFAGIGIAVMLCMPVSAFAARYATITGTVTNTAVGSTQINVVATYTTGGTSCQTGTDNAPTFNVQWDVSPADWVGSSSSGALTDAGAVSPFNYSITTGITPGNTYDIRVVYADANGIGTCGGASQTINGNSVTLPINGLTVGTNSANVDSSTQITVSASFTGDQNANSTTKVEYNTSDAWPGTTKCASISGGSPRSCVVNALLPGTQYWFRVTHTDGDGITGTNPQVIGPYTTPINGLTVGTNSANVDSATQITVTVPFTGDQNGNSTTKVEYNTSNTWPGTTKCASISGGSPRTCVADGLQSGTQYWFRITHTDGDGVTGTNPAVIGPYTTNQAAKLYCGVCHSAPPVDSDNCDNTARGLHGTHLNYSSATYKKTVASYGKCAYCHPVPSGTAPTAAHNNNLTNITGYNAGGINSVGLVDNSKTCTNACHRNRATTATWGNYTSPAIVLGCRACHDDVQDRTGLSGKHGNHLLSNCTTPSSYGLMSAAGNSGCANCHPDNRTDANAFFATPKSDSGTKKVYPHASDGTIVVADAATLQNNISAATKAGLNTTCTNACHPRASAVTWNGTLDCNMCHYWAATPLDTDNTGTGSLSTGHNPHLKLGNQFACTTCHPNNADAAHASKLPAAGYNAVVQRSGMTYDRGTRTCNNSGGDCHGAGSTPTWAGPFNAGCAGCHYYPGAAGGLGSNWPTNNGHNVRYSTAETSVTHLRDNATYNSQTDTFASVVSDVNKCGLCHRNVKVHRNGTGFAHLSSASGYGYCAPNSFAFSTGGVGNGSNVTCSNAKCHSGKTTPNWE